MNDRRKYLRQQLSTFSGLYGNEQVQPGKIITTSVTQGSIERRQYLRKQSNEFLERPSLPDSRSRCHTTFQKSPTKLPFVDITLSAIFFEGKGMMK